MKDDQVNGILKAMDEIERGMQVGTIDEDIGKRLSAILTGVIDFIPNDEEERAELAKEVHQEYRKGINKKRTERRNRKMEIDPVYREEFNRKKAEAARERRKQNKKPE